MVSKIGYSICKAGGLDPELFDINNEAIEIVENEKLDGLTPKMFVEVNKHSQSSAKPTLSSKKGPRGK
jgi:hypothetical protein